MIAITTITIVIIILMKYWINRVKELRLFIVMLADERRTNERYYYHYRFEKGDDDEDVSIG